MENLFFIIFLISVLCLIIGMLNPRIVLRWETDEKRTRKNVLKLYGISIIMSFILFGTTVDPVKAENNVVSEGEGSTEKQTQSVQKSDGEFKVEYINSCLEYEYAQINRSPDTYMGKLAKFTGKVVQVEELWKSRILRVEVDAHGNVIYVRARDRDEGESRILENDFIEIYGELTGIKTYKALLGNKVSIPSIEAKYINAIENSEIKGDVSQIVEDIKKFSIYDLTGVEIVSLENEVDSDQIIELDIYTGAVELPIESYDMEIQKINALAFEKYPDSKNSRNYEIKRERSAFEYLIAEPMSFIKTAAYDKCTKGNKTDWTMAEYDYKDEMESYEYISSEPESIIKYRVIKEKTKGNKIDWSMVEYEYEEEVESYEYISNEPESTIKYYAIKENTIRGEIDWSKTEYEYEDEMEAYKYIANEPESDVKMFSILEHWKGIITDWSQVSYEYDRQMDAYEFLDDIEGIEGIILDKTNGSGYTDWVMVEYEYTNQ